MSGARVALVDPDSGRRRRLAGLARALGLGVEAMAHPPTGAAPQVRLVICAGAMLAGSTAALRAAFPAARVLCCSPDASQGAAVEAFRAGADDFVCLGAGDNELARRIEHHLGCAATGPEDEQHCGLVGESETIRGARRFIARVARTDATVLIGGETGTGKECAALLLHRQSGRAGGPLVALNCAAIPSDLFESELFGFERGAFSGAVSDYPGKLKLADGGTLLLDEVGELDAAGQAKVLRAIETREAYRIGGRRPVHFDARIVAATNRDLAREVAAGRFREDLYYRLAVAVFRMPPLRDRGGDLGPLAAHLLANVIRADLVLSDEAAERLSTHDWPGNARELRNVLEVAAITAEGGRIRAADLPPAFANPARPARPEREVLLEVLARHGGNKAAAARELECSRMTLYRRMARHGIDPDAAPGGVGI